MAMSIPASTIRVYFKKLSNESAITQFHVSGGRIPTAATMRDYWRARLNFDETLDIANPSLLKKRTTGRTLQRSCLHAKKSIGVLDGGSVVGKLLFEAINTYCQGK